MGASRLRVNAGALVLVPFRIPFYHDLSWYISIHVYHRRICEQYTHTYTKNTRNVSLFLVCSVYIYIYIYICVCVCVCVYIYIYIYRHKHTKSTQNSSLFLHSHMVPTKLYYNVTRLYQAWTAHSPSSNCTTTRPSRPVALTQLFILTSLRKRKMHAALRGFKPQFLGRPPPPPSSL